MRRSLPLVLLLLLVGPVFAGDGADPAEVARRYVSEDAGERRGAEAAVACASAETLRAVLREVRARLRAPTPASAPVPQGRVVSVEAWLVDAELDAARRLKLVDEHGRIATRTLALEEEGLMGEAMGSPGVRQVTAPRLAVHDRQRANISVAENTSYVQDVEVVRTEDGAWIADPVVGTLVTGANLEITPRIAEDGTEVLLDLLLELSDLVRPMAQHAMKVGTAEVSVQLPEIRTQRMQKRVPLPVGRTVIVGGWARSTQDETGKTQADRRLVVLLEAHVLDPEEVEVGPAQPSAGGR